jgi:hypothetical protein
VLLVVGRCSCRVECQGFECWGSGIECRSGFVECCPRHECGSSSIDLQFVDGSAKIIPIEFDSGSILAEA